MTDLRTLATRLQEALDRWSNVATGNMNGLVDALQEVHAAREALRSYLSAYAAPLAAVGDGKHSFVWDSENSADCARCGEGPFASVHTVGVPELREALRKLANAHEEVCPAKGECATLIESRAALGASGGEG